MRAIKQQISLSDHEKLFVHADGTTNDFSWVTDLTKRAKSSFPKFELWKNIAGDAEPLFKLLTLMETNLPILPADKQPSA